MRPALMRSRRLHGHLRRLDSTQIRQDAVRLISKEPSPEGRMSRPIPYQPALLRLLHGVTAMLVPLARLCQPANAAALIGLV